MSNSYNYFFFLSLLNNMAERQYLLTSVADMVAAFPVNDFPPIDGRPSLHTLLKPLKIITRCSQKIKSGLGPLGYLFVALPPVHYQRFANVPLVLPDLTPSVPQYTPNMNPAKRNATKLQWQAHKAENSNIQNMKKKHSPVFFFLLSNPRLSGILTTSMSALQHNPLGMCFSHF